VCGLDRIDLRNLNHSYRTRCFTLMKVHIRLCKTAIEIDDGDYINQYFNMLFVKGKCSPCDVFIIVQFLPPFVHRPMPLNALSLLPKFDQFLALQPLAQKDALPFIAHYRGPCFYVRMHHSLSSKSRKVT
jgi:hypothetical protein